MIFFRRLEPESPNTKAVLDLNSKPYLFVFFPSFGGQKGNEEEVEEKGEKGEGRREEVGKEKVDEEEEEKVEEEEEVTMEEETLKEE